MRPERVRKHTEPFFIKGISIHLFTMRPERVRKPQSSHRKTWSSEIYLPCDPKGYGNTQYFSFSLHPRIIYLPCDPKGYGNFGSCFLFCPFVFIYLPCDPKGYGNTQRSRWSTAVHRFIYHATRKGTETPYTHLRQHYGHPFIYHATRKGTETAVAWIQLVLMIIYLPCDPKGYGNSYSSSQSRQWTSIYLPCDPKGYGNFKRAPFPKNKNNLFTMRPERVRKPFLYHS